MGNQTTDGDASRASEKVYTKEEVRAFLTDIEQRIINSKQANLHSMVALNQLLSLPHADQLFDDELKGQMRDIWIKLKSTGVQLGDPPILFGLPTGFGKEDENAKINQVDGT